MEKKIASGATAPPRLKARRIVEDSALILTTRGSLVRGEISSPHASLQFASIEMRQQQTKSVTTNFWEAAKYHTFFLTDIF